MEEEDEKLEDVETRRERDGREGEDGMKRSEGAAGISDANRVLFSFSFSFLFLFILAQFLNFPNFRSPVILLTFTAYIISGIKTNF